MLANLSLITLWITFAFAQTDLGTLPSCAQDCVSAVAQSQNCVLLTQQCLCPAELDIHLCISRSCRLEDLAPSNSIINSFCQGSVSSSTTPIPSKPPITPPVFSTPPPQSPTTQTTTILLSPSNTFSSSSSSTSSTSSITTITTSSSSTTNSSIISIITPTPSSSLSTTEPLETVIVFSTQFAPPAPPTLSNNGRSSFIRSNTEISRLVLFGIMGVLFCVA